jgi:hypothetical protein
VIQSKLVKLVASWKKRVGAKTQSTAGRRN